MNTSMIEETVAKIPPALTAAEANAFPNGRWTRAASGAMPRPEVKPVSLLPAAEALELRFCEERIERGLETFVEVGLALSLIRDGRLYRATHDTFDAYCIERWEIKSSRARQLCAAAEIVQGLKSKVRSGRLPTSERQVRPLLGLHPDQQEAIWSEAVATAPNGNVTSKHVAGIVARMTGKSSRTATGTTTIDAGTRPARVRAAAERAIASVRELLELQGTADSEQASNVVVSLSQLEDFSAHLAKVEKLQEARQ